MHQLASKTADRMIGTPTDANYHCRPSPTRRSKSRDAIRGTQSCDGATRQEQPLLPAPRILENVDGMVRAKYRLTRVTRVTNASYDFLGYQSETETTCAKYTVN